MEARTLSQFVEETAQEDKGHGLFELETPRMLEVNLDGEVWTKMGSMISYHGQIKFEREGMMEQGLGNLLKKAVSGEGAYLTRAKGQGKMYLADQGKKILLLRLEGDSFTVNGSDILAFEPQITHDIRMMKRVSAMASGGLFNINMEGTGLVAITSHYEPLTLRVTPDRPLRTDPNATIAWSRGVEPALKTDMSLKTFLGRGSGETFQMEFTGDGFVVMQPFEEVTYAQSSS
jgi:uncharacterized protein (AIM24 family)